MSLHSIDTYDHLNNDDPEFQAVVQAVLKKAINRNYGAVRVAADLVRLMEGSPRFYHQNSNLAQDIRKSIEAGAY